MNGRYPGAAFLAVLATATVAVAGGFWADKPHGEWTEGEVGKLMSSSPWAKAVTVRLTTQDMGGGFAGEEASGAGVAGEEGDRTHVTVIWSSRAVRMAQVRKRQLGGTPVDAETEKKFLDSGSTQSYVLVLQAGIGPMKAMTEEQLMEASTLRIGKKKDARTVKPAKVEKPADGGGWLALLYFPSGETPITEADGEVTLVTKIGRYPVEPTFDLAAMKSGGQLDLQ